MNSNEILKLHEIIGTKSMNKGLFPISKSTWYRGVRAGIYPSPVKLSTRRVGWLRSDIDALIENLQKKPPDLPGEEGGNNSGLGGSIPRLR